MHDLYALKEMLCKQLKEYGRKGELSAAILERVDMLAHAAKNLDKIIEVYEMEEEESGGSSYDMSSRRGRSRAGGESGQSRRRDRMGRYSSEGSSRYGGGSSRYDGGSSRYDGGSSRYGGGSSRYDGGSSYEAGMEEMVESIRGMMQELPQEVQRDAQRFVQKLEEQM